MCACSRQALRLDSRTVRNLDEAITALSLGHRPFARMAAAGARPTNEVSPRRRGRAHGVSAASAAYARSEPLTRRSTASYIAAVTVPVFVFCRDGWYMPIKVLGCFSAGVSAFAA